MADRIQVSARMRKRTEAETATRSPVVVSVADDFHSSSEPYVVVENGQSGDNGKVYTLDQVYGPNADQQLVYEQLARPLFQDFVCGLNVTILAYGSTGSGKTYTMLGEMAGDKAGIVPRVLSDLFTSVRDDFRVKLSCVELYKEELHDLINDETELVKNQKLRLVGDGSGTAIQGLVELDVANASDGFEVLQKCLEKRKTSATKLNARSSRSHTIFTVHLFRQTGPDAVRVSKMHLVDLAGSEDVSKSGARDARAREAGSINQSLLTLGKVIHALSEGSDKGHVPYRESKLTRLLQGSIGGNTKTALVATISPAKSALMETMSTLNYACKAKNIRNLPQSSADSAVVLKKTSIREMSAELSRLQRDVMASRGKDHSVRVSVASWEGQARRIFELNSDISERDTEISGLKAKLAARDADLAAKDVHIAQLHSQADSFKAQADSSRKDLYALRQELSLLKDKYSSQRERVSSVTGRGLAGVIDEISKMVDDVKMLTKVSLAVKEIPISVGSTLEAARHKIESRLAAIQTQFEREMDSVDALIAQSLDLDFLEQTPLKSGFRSETAQLAEFDATLSSYIHENHLRSSEYQEIAQKIHQSVSSATELLQKQALEQISGALQNCVQSATSEAFSQMERSSVSFLEAQKALLVEKQSEKAQKSQKIATSITTQADEAHKSLMQCKEQWPERSSALAQVVREKTERTLGVSISDISEAVNSGHDKVRSQAAVETDTASSLLESTGSVLARALGSAEHNMKVFDASLSELQRSPQFRGPASSPPSRSPSRSPMRPLNRSPDKRRRLEPGRYPQLSPSKS